MSNVNPFRRVSGIEDQKLIEVQDSATQVFSDIVSKAILAGRLIETSITTTVQIEHGLQRVLRGWIIVDRDSAADVYRTNKDRPAAELNLTASAAVNLKLWVF